MNTFKTLLAAACVLAPTTALAACTGPFANAVVQNHAKTILADVKSKDQKSRLGAVGVLKMLPRHYAARCFASPMHCRAVWVPTRGQYIANWWNSCNRPTTSLGPNAFPT
jgi:hypothetical protein